MLVLQVVYFEQPVNPWFRSGILYSQTFWDLMLWFPGLHRTKLILRNFPGPRKWRKKIQEPWFVELVRLAHSTENCRCQILQLLLLLLQVVG